MMAGTLAQVSTLLMQVGLPHSPLWAGIGRPRPRLAQPAFDRGDQGRFLAADEGAGAPHDLDVEIEARAQDVLAQKAVIAGLLEGDGQPLDGQRVLVPDIDESRRRADGFGPDDHPFDDRMRVGFEDAPVHEGARVAFVAVADEVFLPAVRR